MASRAAFIPALNLSNNTFEFVSWRKGNYKFVDSQWDVFIKTRGLPYLVKSKGRFNWSEANETYFNIYNQWFAENEIRDK